MAGDSSVDSARVSRSAAVWVAAITAVGGFATAVVTGSFGLQRKPEAVVQRWLKISSVELSSAPGLPPIDRVHLIAEINGVRFAFPTSTSTLWAAVGPGMVSERYPLPIDQDRYRVRFYAIGATTAGVYPRYEHKGFAEFEPRWVPLKNATQSLQLSESGPDRLKVAMTVRYSIE